MAKKKPKRNPCKRQSETDKKTHDNITISTAVKSGSFRFVVAFVLSCIGLYACIHELPPIFTQPINEHTAWTTGLVLNTFGIPVSTVNDIISGDRFALKIIPECTALFMVSLFLSFVVFYPATVRQKAVGLAMGISALYLGNLARLVATFMLGRYDRRLFEVAHVYLGQVFTIVLVIMGCHLWLKWLDKEESKWMTAVGFLTRFAIISGCLFLVWMNIHYWYIGFLDELMSSGFSLFNYNISLAHDTLVYYETFSIVTLISFAFADLSVSWRIKIKGLCAGLVVLVSIHLFHRIDNVLIVAFHFTAAASADLTLLLIGQYLVPFLFLIFLVYQKKKMHPVVPTK